MSLYSWRCFKVAQSHASCVAGREDGVNYTSHHLRCEQLRDVRTRRSSRERYNQRARISISRAWPGTTPPRKFDDEDSFSNVFTPQPELRYTYRDPSNPSSGVDQPTENHLTPSKSSPTPHQTLLKTPSRCRLPTSIRFTTVLLYMAITILFLTSPTLATPLLTSNQHHRLHNRQAIPDRTGNTGNEPAPVAPDVPPRPFTPSASLNPTATASVAEVPTFSFNPSTPTPTPSEQPQPQPTQTLPPNTNGNTSSPDEELGAGPTRPAAPLTLTSANFSMSPGAIVGIAAGGVVLLLTTFFVGIWLYRRHRRPEVEEIPIRRSKLGSRLGLRIFGDSGSRSGSRAVSRSSSRSRKDSVASNGAANEKDVEAGGDRGSRRWLDKGTISRPRNAWLENGLLSVPKPGFLREEKEGRAGERGEAPWAAREDRGRFTISAPRPGRPASAEPLGRLSGMGLGMGYLR